jgi:hypothetical protein
LHSLLSHVIFSSFPFPYLSLFFTFLEPTLMLAHDRNAQKAGGAAGG